MNLCPCKNQKLIELTEKYQHVGNSGFWSLLDRLLMLPWVRLFFPLDYKAQMILWDLLHSVIPPITCSSTQQTCGRAVVFSTVLSEEAVREKMVLSCHMPLSPKNHKALLWTPAWLEWTGNTFVIVTKFPNFSCKMRTNVFYLTGEYVGIVSRQAKLPIFMLPE